MNSNLWGRNTPSKFWNLHPNPSYDQWNVAVANAIPKLGMDYQTKDFGNIPHLILGEGQFGRNHWDLSKFKRVYYLIKPVLPRKFIEKIKTINAQVIQKNFPLNWPIEDRYAQFQWEVIRQILNITGQSSLSFQPFWPDGKRFAFVLTHDIESAVGQTFVRAIADIEEGLGFRSSFNFVPESYPLDYNLMDDLRNRGFEIGVHGLMHDGKLFNSYDIFLERVERINDYLIDFDAVGFRAPLMHRNPEWLQALNIEYDLSFFDTDPFEPIPGGCMSIWPFFVGRFVELPYTLVQDSTLHHTLGENTPRIWLDKVNFIEKFHGMALLNTHPDYLKKPILLKTYVDFLKTLKQKDNYWHVLPREIAQWWRNRSKPSTENISSITNLLF